MRSRLRDRQKIWFIAVTGEYDGSAPVNIEIPQSGGGGISENKLTVNNHIISLESGGSSA